MPWELNSTYCYFIINYYQFCKILRLCLCVGLTNPIEFKRKFLSRRPWPKRKLCAEFHLNPFSGSWDFENSVFLDFNIKIVLQNGLVVSWIPIVYIIFQPRSVINSSLVQVQQLITTIAHLIRNIVSSCRRTCRARGSLWRGA